MYYFYSQLHNDPNSQLHNDQNSQLYNDKKKLSQYESFINMETLCNLGFVHESF